MKDVAFPLLLVSLAVACSSSEPVAATPSSEVSGTDARDDDDDDDNDDETEEPSDPGPSAGGAGGKGGEGGLGGSGGSACVDSNEPDDDENQALALEPIDDCDESGGTLKGVLSSPTDVDWYVLKATDVAGCSVDPSRSIEGEGRLCVFFQCTSGKTEFDCPGGTTGTKSPAGRPGCCANEPGGSISLSDVDCTDTGDDDVLLFIRVDNPKAEACAPYSISYHY